MIIDLNKNPEHILNAVNNEIVTVDGLSFTVATDYEMVPLLFGAGNMGIYLYRRKEEEEELLGEDYGYYYSHVRHKKMAVWPREVFMKALRGGSYYNG